MGPCATSVAIHTICLAIRLGSMFTAMAIHIIKLLHCNRMVDDIHTDTDTRTLLV